jgi:ABC-2 type transport system permease protein
MRILYLLRKEMIEIFRQKEMLFFIFVAPVIQVVILGYVVTTDVRNIPVQVVNLSKNMTARRLVTRIESSPLFDVKQVVYRPVKAVEVFKEGRALSIIVLRDGHDTDRQDVHYPEVQILMDGIDANTALVAAGYFNGMISKYILEDAGKKGLKWPLEIRPLIRFNPSLKSINYMGPGIVALLLTITAMFLTSIGLVREREQQTMDTLLISRLRPIEIYIGKALPMAILGLVEMGIGLVVVILFFGIPLRGNLFYLLLAAVIFLFALLAYAILISIISSSQQQALFFSWFSMVTFLMLSGLFTPVENIPAAFRWLADINPLRYLVKIIREIFLKGNGIAYFSRDLLILGAITVIVFSLSLINFRRLISK